MGMPLSELGLRPIHNADNLGAYEFEDSVERMIAELKGLVDVLRVFRRGDQWAGWGGPQVDGMWERGAELEGKYWEVDKEYRFDLDKFTWECA